MPELKKETMQNYLQLARDAVEQKDYDTATDHLISVLQFDSNNSEAIGIMGDMALSKKERKGNRQNILSDGRKHHRTDYLRFLLFFLSFQCFFLLFLPSSGSSMGGGAGGGAMSSMSVSGVKPSSLTSAGCLD